MLESTVDIAHLARCLIAKPLYVKLLPITLSGSRYLEVLVRRIRKVQYADGSVPFRFESGASPSILYTAEAAIALYLSGSRDEYRRALSFIINKQRSDGLWSEVAELYDVSKEFVCGLDYISLRPKLSAYVCFVLSPLYRSDEYVREIIDLALRTLARYLKFEGWFGATTVPDIELTVLMAYLCRLFRGDLYPRVYRFLTNFLSSQSQVMVLTSAHGRRVYEVVLTALALLPHVDEVPGVSSVLSSLLRSSCVDGFWSFCRRAKYSNYVESKHVLSLAIVNDPGFRDGLRVALNELSELVMRVRGVAQKLSIDYVSELRSELISATVSNDVRELVFVAFLEALILSGYLRGELRNLVRMFSSCDSVPLSVKLFRDFIMSCDEGTVRSVFDFCVLLCRYVIDRVSSFIDEKCKLATLAELHRFLTLRSLVPKSELVKIVERAVYCFPGVSELASQLFTFICSSVLRLWGDDVSADVRCPVLRDLLIVLRNVGLAPSYLLSLRSKSRFREEFLSLIGDVTENEWEVMSLLIIVPRCKWGQCASTDARFRCPLYDFCSSRR
ncbi:MAG: hypothetical protein DRJ40_08795 [Thermoprotei archaeon]|nr:MAG: hypothetical protein DRJ40_08795 [Thermoprotei archaeon]